jgi:hypothetical protein
MLYRGYARGACLLHKYINIWSTNDEEEEECGSEIVVRSKRRTA